MIDWKAIDDDDFIFKDGPYTLRVEQMDDDEWWWAVYFEPKGTQQDGRGTIGFDSTDEIFAKTEQEAKIAAEAFYKSWKKALKLYSGEAYEENRDHKDQS